MKHWQLFLFFLFLIKTPFFLHGQENPTSTHEPLVPMEEVLPETTSDNFYGEFIKMLLLLGVIISLLLLAMWFLRRMMTVRIEQMNETSTIKILDRRVVSAKTALYVVEISEKKFILAESQGHVTLSEVGHRKPFALENRGEEL